jgi:AhpD family alkylhydroperoxidase
VEFEAAVYKPGHLSTKIKELIAVGVTHVTQCDACIALHTRNARLAGATDEEIAEAVFVAIELRAGAPLVTSRLRLRPSSIFTNRVVINNLEYGSAMRQPDSDGPHVSAYSGILYKVYI